MNQQTYRKLISGQSAGIVAWLLRCLLRIASTGYAVGVGVRNLLYSRGWLEAHRVDAAVISIGNITVGGTGKTPLVVWLCRQIVSNFTSQISSSQCAILTRGYKSRTRETEQFSDEVALLAQSLPDVKVIVNPDRVAGAAEAIGRFGAKVLIMDDGFQHRRLARDLDIVAVDATQPFGYGKLLPAGLLREPLSSLKRAQAAVITRCNQVIDAELDGLEKKLLAINPKMVIARSIHDPVCAKSADGRQISIEQLKGKKVFAFCGIANPEAFLGTLSALGCKLVGSEVYDDHYQYTDRSLADIHGQAGRLGADLILTTQKDWAKIVGLTTGRKGAPLAYLSIEIKFIAGQDQLTSLIEDRLAGKIPQGG